MYSCLIGSDRISLKCTEFSLKCTENRPQMYRIRPQMYVHLRLICTFEADLIYFLMWSVWANQTAVHLRSQSDSSTFEADLYIWGRIPYIWGRSVHLRPISVHLRPIGLYQGRGPSDPWASLTDFMADRTSSPGLKCTDFWEKIGLKCMEFGLKCTYIWGRSPYIWGRF